MWQALGWLLVICLAVVAIVIVAGWIGGQWLAAVHASEIAGDVHCAACGKPIAPERARLWDEYGEYCTPLCYAAMKRPRARVKRNEKVTH